MQFEHGDSSVKTTRAAGALFEALAAAGAAVLSIIGLAGIAPMFLAAIATVVLGVALLIEGGGLVTHHDHAFADKEGLTRTGDEVGRTSAESIAGIAGIVLGIFSLLRVSPRFLLPISLIVFGAGLLMGAGIDARGKVMGSGHVLVGVAGIVLGILALIGVGPMTLVLIGLLAIGFAVLISGTAWGARHLHPLHHAHHAH
jgi:hypothetical protein